MDMVADQNFVALNGVVQGQTQPVFLGLAGLCERLDDRQRGSFCIGFDNRFQPAQVRIFYQPPSNILGDVVHMGLIQFGQYLIQGEPLPPERYSAEIDYKNAYRKPFLIAPEQYWTDIMDPVSANQLLRNNGTPSLPLFPFNARVVYPGASFNFYQHGAPNGSLLKMNQGFQAGDSLAASLVAPVGLDIDILDEQAIIREKQKYSGAPPVLDVVCDSQALAGRDLIQFILEQFNLILLNDPEATEPLLDSDVQWVKVCGEHVLIKFRDPEDMGSIYCVFFQGDRLIALNFDNYQLRPHIIEANGHIFEQYKTYKQVVGHFNTFVGRNVQPPRGRSSLGMAPFFDFGNKVIVSFVNQAVAYAVSPTKWWPVIGVQWQANRAFDFTELEWGPVHFNRPRSLLFFRPNDIYDLTEYADVMSSQTPPQYPTANPKVWFEVPRVPIVSRPITYVERSTQWIQ
jgi:hypothetical protein